MTYDELGPTEFYDEEKDCWQQVPLPNIDDDELVPRALQAYANAGLGELPIDSPLEVLAPICVDYLYGIHYQKLVERYAKKHSRTQDRVSMAVLEAIARRYDWLGLESGRRWAVPHARSSIDEH